MAHPSTPTRFIASTSQVLWRILESKGVDPAPVFRNAGLDPRLWNEPGARFSVAALNQAWADATKITRDPCIGLKAAGFVNPASLQALGFAWLASDTLFDALSRLVRYSRLLSDGLVLELAVSGQDCRLVIDTSVEDMGDLPVRMDAFFAGILALSRMITTDALNATALSLGRAPPPCAQEFHRLFGTLVRFDAGEDSITFARDAAERPLPTGNRWLAHQNDQVIDDYLQRFNSDTFADRVRSRLITLLPSGAFSEREIAAALHLSTRTLQRRLSAEGTSFKFVLDEARQVLATRYIGEDRLSIKETSYLLGFSEPSNFSRAFKRWTGNTPARFRDDSKAVRAASNG